MRSLSPVMRNQAGFGDLIDVAFQREHGNIRIEPADDGARLGSGRSIGTANADVLPGLLFPMLLKSGNDVSFVGLLGHAIGRQNQIARFRGFALVRRLSATGPGRDHCDKQARHCVADGTHQDPSTRLLWANRLNV